MLGLALRDNTALESLSMAGIGIGEETCHSLGIHPTRHLTRIFQPFGTCIMLIDTYNAPCRQGFGPQSEPDGAQSEQE